MLINESINKRSCPFDILWLRVKLGLTALLLLLLLLHRSVCFVVLKLVVVLCNDMSTGTANGCKHSLLSSFWMLKKSGRASASKSQHCTISCHLQC